MSRLSLTRWALATVAFMLLGWAVREYGLNSARVILGALLLMVYFFGGYGKKAPPEGVDPSAAAGPSTEELSDAAIEPDAEVGPPKGSELQP